MKDGATGTPLFPDEKVQLLRGCFGSACTCKTLRQALTCENWKKVDVV